MTTEVTNKAVRMIGVGSALPSERVSNDQLAERLGKLDVQTSDQWIRERTGIESRYFVDAKTTTSDLALTACQQALAHANVDPKDIELIIVATSTPDMIFPSTACQVQRKLGINRCAAFDVQAVCSGFVYAVTIANAMMRAQNYKKALVIGAEVFSRILDWRDRGTCVLFGDGAGALVLSLEESSTEQASKQGIIECEVNADGRYSDILHVPGQIHQGDITGDPFLRMDGQAVFKFAVNVLAECAENLLQRVPLASSQVDWLIPHQANKRIMTAIGRKLNVPENKTISCVEEYANTSAASIPMALSVAVHDGRINAGNTILLLGVGGGFTWGGVLATWG